MSDPENGKKPLPRITIDADLHRKLQDIVYPVELCNSAGQVVGRYEPVLNPEVYTLEPQISEEELERRSKSNEKTYTTAEVIAHLESL
jgi:hypothetical protein